MKKGNPAISQLNRYTEEFSPVEQSATYRGVFGKSLLFLGIVLASALVSSFLFNGVIVNSDGLYYALTVVCLIGAAVSGILAYRFATPIIGSIYCVCEGFLVGCVSAVVDAEYSGFVLAALLTTMGVLAVAILLNMTGILKPNQKFRNFFFTALIALVVCQLLLLLLALIIPSLYVAMFQNFWLQLLISGIMVMFATFSVMIDVDNVTSLVNARLDKSYEWKAAFGLIVSLVWLYLEVLRLLVLLSDRKN